jgi:hypothetical protein
MPASAVLERNDSGQCAAPPQRHVFLMRDLRTHLYKIDSGAVLPLQTDGG